MAKDRSSKVSLTFRVSAESAKRWKEFCRDHSGKPLYIRPGEIGEKALMAEVDRQLLILSGALPMDRITGTDKRLNRIRSSKQCGSLDRVMGVSPTAENVGCRKLDSGGRDQAVRLAW